MRGLQTRLLLTVGTLALVAVVAVALLARQGTRQEFRRLAELELRADQAPGADATSRVGAHLDGRCCAAGTLAAAARDEQPMEKAPSKRRLDGRNKRLEARLNKLNKPSEASRFIGALAYTPIEIARDLP